ncbi:MAG: GNAT family N-acetyltransferase [Rhizobiales bacterium]|nr:GNAT family N-acetyltransferase [Hyphomicrobiales bacterium]
MDIGHGTDAIARPRFVNRFWPMPDITGFTRLLPSLRTNGGFRVWLPQPVHVAAPLGRIGSLEVRLAQNTADIRKAQRLRYRVFYRHGSAIAGASTMLARRDIDVFDDICDHLLVIDHASGRRSPQVVGTYRLLPQEVAARNYGFYTSREFDIDGLVSRHRSLRFLELGRSCVLPQYRSKRTVELLWLGVWAYVRQYRFDVMFGCASINGTDPDKLALALSFLHHYGRASEAWRAPALPKHIIGMNRMPREAIDPRAGLRILPPLIKGYMRLGCYIGDGAVIDSQFGTTDVLIILPVSAINARYLKHFGEYGAGGGTQEAN